MKKNHSPGIICYQHMFRKIHYKTLPSTHLFALDHLVDFGEEKVVIIADSQPHGIGRKRTPWISPIDGNLLLTFVFLFHNQFETSNLAQVLSYSCMKVLESLGFCPLFKWPNDILLSHKKVGGAMGEIKGKSAIVSIGVNVNMPRVLLDTIDIPATSLLEEAHHPFDLSKLLESLVDIFSNDLLIFQKEGFSPFYDAFAAKLAFLYKEAKVGNYQGEIAGLAKDGRLLLKTKEGVIPISSGSLEIL